MTSSHQYKFPYRWTLRDANFTKDKGRVFSCFACGGGSTMGYKLAGFDVIGCNEIDPRMMDVYRRNHQPKYSFLEAIQDFKTRKDLPEELYKLDILDGSPPCSSFSVAGNRDKDWGKEKHFREGQAKQVLDTLFFDFIDLAERLQPKVVIAENVKGLLLGNAIEYVRRIYEAFDNAGYYVQHYLLDAQTMGVPQRRERVFFVGLRKDLATPFLQWVNLFEQKPALTLDFNEPPIPFRDVADFRGENSLHPSCVICGTIGNSVTLTWGIPAYAYVGKIIASTTDMCTLTRYVPRRRGGARMSISTNHDTLVNRRSSTYHLSPRTTTSEISHPTISAGCPYLL